jgi:hypothetical protein
VIYEIPSIGQKLDDFKQLMEHGCDKVYKEKISGGRGEAAEAVQKDDIDMIDLTKLDKFTRSIKEALRTYNSVP